MNPQNGLCICCGNTYASKLYVARYCQPCAAILRKFQSRASRAVRESQLPDVERFMCVDCGERQASEYDHRYYTKPLEVDPVCVRCNQRRGPALDAVDIVRAWRGL